MHCYHFPNRIQYANNLRENINESTTFFKKTNHHQYQNLLRNLEHIRFRILLTVKYLQGAIFYNPNYTQQAGHLMKSKYYY